MLSFCIFFQKSTRTQFGASITEASWGEHFTNNEDASWNIHTPYPEPTCHNPVWILAQLWIEPPATLHLGKQQVVAEVVDALPLVWETDVAFPAPGSGPVLSVVGTGEVRQQIKVVQQMEFVFSICLFLPLKFFKRKRQFQQHFHI